MIKIITPHFSALSSWIDPTHIHHFSYFSFDHFEKDNYFDAIKGSSLAAILTEWDEFKDYDWEDLVKTMKNPSIVYDGRNILPDLDKKINYIKLGVTQY